MYWAKYTLYAILAAPLLPAATRISDHLAMPGGSDASGIVHITVTSACTAASGVRVEAVETPVSLVGGLLTIDLEPNDTCLPLGSRYRVVYSLVNGVRHSEYWYVPTSAQSLHINDVLWGTALSPISLSQLGQTNATDGQTILWNASTQRWQPGAAGQVASVFARTGAVVAQQADYGAFYAPLAHTHLVGDVTSLQTALDGKAAANHAHAGMYEPVDATLLRQANLAGSGIAATPAKSDHWHSSVSKADGSGDAITCDANGTCSLASTVFRGGDGAVLPATCAIGDTYFLHVGTPGLYQCTATDAWTLPGGGGKRILLAGRAAICQSGVAGAGFSLPAANAPTAVCAADGIQAHLAFTAATAQTVYDRFELPTDWSGALTLVTTAWSTSTDAPTINAYLACADTAAVASPTFGSAIPVTMAPGPASGRTRVATTLATTCTAEQAVYLQLTITAAAAGALNLMTAQVTE